MTEAYLGWDDLGDLDQDEANAEVEKRLEALPADQLAQIAVMAAAELMFLGWTSTPAAKLQVASHYGIDILAVRDKVAEDLERQQAGGDVEEEREEEAAA